MPDLLVSDDSRGIAAFAMASVHVAVETREGARGDLYPDAMARQKDMRNRPKLDGKFIDSAGFQQFGLIESTTPFGAQHPVCDVVR